MSGFANDTPIGTPDGSKQIFLLGMMDKVSAASLALQAGKIQLGWTAQSVEFSSGTGSAGHQPVMVSIVLQGKDYHKLICSMDQPFLLATGKLTTAARLRAGQQLVDQDGGALSVQRVSTGAYDCGVHHIATAVPWTGTVDGHLLLAGGVVAGDFVLQIRFAQLDGRLKEPEHDVLPLVGTPE